MIEPHTRAAYVQNQPTEQWYHFLVARFVGSLKRAGWFAVLVRGAVQRGPAEAEISGILEQADQTSLPVVLDFVGSVNLETREVVISDSNEGRYRGQFSANGRVMTLRKDGTGQELRLVHEETLRYLSI